MAPELPLREEVAKALVNKGITLIALGRGDDEIAVYDDLLDRFGAAAELPLRELVAKALLNKGVRLGVLGRTDDAIAVYDDFLARFGAAVTLREEVAKVLFNKGTRLCVLGRSDDEIAVYDDILARFGAADELPVRELVAKALFNKGVRLGAVGRGDEAIAVYDDLLARFGAADELLLREQVARALINKGVTLGALGRSNDAIAVYDDMLARFGAADELSLRNLVAFSERSRKLSSLQYPSKMILRATFGAGGMEQAQAMLYENATIKLTENSTAGHSSQVFPNQTVEITHEGDVFQTSVDGKTGKGARPHEIIWHGGRAIQFEAITNVAIYASNGKVLLDGSVCRNVDVPHDVTEGVKFFVLGPD